MAVGVLTLLAPDRVMLDPFVLCFVRSKTEVSMRFRSLALAGALCLGTMISPQRAGACETDVVVRPVESADQLNQRAATLDSQASIKETTATTLDRDASDAESRARQLRSSALGTTGANRETILARADGISAQATVLRTQARQRRTDAAELRTQARDLRNRALAIQSGWQNRRVTAAI
jgi:hypothetical protein